MQVVGDESYRVREEALKGICAFPPELIFPRLEAFLRNHDDAQVRNAAIQAFPRYGEKATSYLLELLQDVDPDIRIFSALMLGSTRDPLGMDGLIAALKDPSENVRHAAAESLGKLRDHRAIPPLIECLDSDFWTQYPAVVALGEIGDPAAIEPLTALLEDDMLRQVVIRSLGSIGDPAALPVLAEMLTQNDPETRDDTIAALVKISSQAESESVSGNELLSRIPNSLQNEDVVTHLLDSLGSQELEVRKNAVIALGWLRETRAQEKLVSMLEEYELEEYVVGSLAAMGDASLPGITRALANPAPRVRAAAIRCLDLIGHPDGLKACLASLEDGHDEVRFQAVAALEQICEIPEVEDALLARIRDRDPDFRGAVVEVLGKSRSPSLGPKLLEALKDENPLARLAAVQLLTRIGRVETLPALEPLLFDSSDEVRAHAYQAVSMIAPQTLSSETLLRGISDESPLVKTAAVRCLAASAGSAALPHLIPLLNDPDPQIQLTVIESLGKIGDPASVPPLTGFYQKANRRFKVAIIRALGSVRDRSSVQCLTESLKQADPEIKRIILEALGNLGEKSATPGIVVALEDTDWRVRVSALWSLGKIGDRKNLNHLMARLNDPEDIVKKEAIAALADLGAVESVPAILLLLRNENLTLEVVSALEKLGVPYSDSFYDFMRRSPTYQKCLLVDMLGRRQESKSVPYLGRMLSDEPLPVRVRIARALGNIGDQTAFAFLLRAQKEDPNPEVRKEAARALTRLGPGA